MINRKKKICNECETEQYIWARGKCKDCNQRISMAEQLQIRTKIRTSGNNDSGFQNKQKRIYPISKKKKPTGEAILFKVIWETRSHICINCKIPLGNEAKTFYFSHIKSKKQFPELRLLAENIQLLCWDCHYAYDFQTKDKFDARKDLFKNNKQR